MKFKDYPYRDNDWIIVAINHGWKACEKQWDWLVCASDLREKVKPIRHQGEVIFINSQYMAKKYEGTETIGRGSMLLGSYMIANELNPDIMGYLGADMNYTPDKNGNTHIYGVGRDVRRGCPDPDRIIEHEGGDPDYFAKKFKDFSYIMNVRCYNFSDDPETRLPFEQVNPEDIDNVDIPPD